MNILVCLKIVSQMQFYDSLNENVDRFSGGQLMINPADMYALEAALKIKDSKPDTTVTVITMAPAGTEPFLREAIAVGADAAVLISDSRAAASDTLVTSKILAAALRQLPPQDLILCGKKAIDSETGHIGPRLATMLSLPFCTNVVRFSLEGDLLRLIRVQENGLAEYTGQLPALLTICNGTEMVREATIAGLRRGRQAEIRRLDLDALGVAPEAAGLRGSPTRTVTVYQMEFHKGNRVSAKSVKDGVKEISKLLRRCGEEAGLDGQSVGCRK